MVSIDYCILTMEIMEIDHKCSSDNIPKYGNDKGFWIFSNYIPRIKQKTSRCEVFFFSY
jgi:hypothetical protein